MDKSSMQQLAEFGQSIWLDYIDRPLLETGKLKGLIDQGLRGMTSNPSIFNAAIGKSSEYDGEILELKEQNKSTFEIYDALTIKDIQDACDQFLCVYQQTEKLDGYVSLEIDPLLAAKVEDQIKEGKRLYNKVNRPNVMIKVPATKEGIPVVEELIANGINVNATLIFSRQQYEEAANAYIKGLVRYAEEHDDLSGIHSVASVFVSRVDTAVDKLLQEKFDEVSDDKAKGAIKALLGTAATANSRIIFEKSKSIFSQDIFMALVAKKANLQRVLWASTGTKNPDYSDIKYVTELISKPTVNTLPEKTLNAYLDHGDIIDALDDDCKDSLTLIDQMKDLGIDMNEVNDKLLADGVKAFEDAFKDLFSSIDEKANKLSLA